MTTAEQLAQLQATRETLDQQATTIARQMIEIEKEITRLACPFKAGDLVTFTDGRGTQKGRVKTAYYHSENDFHLTLAQIRRDGTEGQTRWHISTEYNEVRAVPAPETNANA